MPADASPEPTADFTPEGAELQEEERARAYAGEPPAVGGRPPADRIAASIKDSAIAAIITLALAAPLVGLETVAVGASSNLQLDTHWGSVAIAVAVVFFGRLLLNVFVWKAERPVTGRLAGGLGALPAVPNVGYVAAGLFLLGAFAVPAATVAYFPLQSRYVLDLGTLILTYVMLGWGLNIVVGLAGLLDLGYVAFYAVGAYSYALIAEHMGWSFWACLPFAGMLAACWGLILGFPVLRLRGDYLAIVTLAFGEMIRLILINWYSFTHGPDGINNVPRPSFFGLDFSRDADGFAAHFGLKYSPNHRIVFLYYLILVLALITNFVTLRIRQLPVGRAWEALREDEIACRSLGINTTNTKLTAFAMGAMFGGFAGSFFATRQGFISPESFNFVESATILAIVVLGGLGSQIGVAVAAVVMIGGIEMLRNLTFLKMVFGPDFDPDPVPHADLRSGHGGDHGVAAARSRVDPKTVRLPQAPEGGIRRARRRGPRMTRWETDPILTIEHLSMRFGGLVAVNDLSFSVGRGDITALIGPNGAGKTTVFNCVTGFYKPTEGRIALAHTPDAFDASRRRLTAARGRIPRGGLFLLERMPENEITHHARVARTFQNIRLFGGMTVLENLMVAQHNKLMTASGYSVIGLFGLPSYRAALQAAIDKSVYWLKQVGLLERADDPAADLPYGAQRRLEIARAMCTDPLLLCLDEPAAGLNPHESAELNELLRFIRDEHDLSVLLIEHDMGVVMEISDHIIVLDYGVKISDGSAEFVRNDPRVVAAYLGVADEEIEQVAKEVAH